MPREQEVLAEATLPATRPFKFGSQCEKYGRSQTVLFPFSRAPPCTSSLRRLVAAYSSRSGNKTAVYFHLDKDKFVLDFVAKLSKIVQVNRTEREGKTTVCTQ